MNKWFYLAILAVLAVPAGCTHTEQVSAPPKVVAFRVGSYAPQTRAESIKTVDGITSFCSKGFLHAEGVSAAQPFFGEAGETISYHESPAEWTPSHDYYWPKSANSYVNFVSWYDNGTVTSGARKPAVSYTVTSDGTTIGMEWSGITVATTDNILWADVAWRYNANAETYLKDNIEEGIPTLFHHALARVKFQAKLSKAQADDTSADDVKWTARITGLNLAAVKNQGTLALTNADPNSNQTNPWTGTGEENAVAWTIAESSTDTAISMTNAAGLELGATAVEVIGFQSVLPQTLTDDNILTVNYSVVTTYGSASDAPYIVESREASVKLTDFSGGITAWEMNKQYTYTIIINPDSGIIELIPVEKDWTAAVEYNLNVE